MEATPRDLISHQLRRALQWRLQPVMRSAGRQGRNDWRFLAAVLWMLRTEASWQDLPSYFGRWNSVYRRFRRRAVSGPWEALRPFDPAATPYGRGNFFGVGCFESTYVKATLCSGETVASAGGASLITPSRLQPRVCALNYAQDPRYAAACEGKALAMHAGRGQPRTRLLGAKGGLR